MKHFDRKPFPIGLFISNFSLSEWTCPDGCEEYPATAQFRTNSEMTRATNPVSKRSTENDISDLGLHVVKRDLSANQMIVTEERSAAGPRNPISRLVETLRNNRIHFRKRNVKAPSTLPYKNTTTSESAESSESKTFHGAVRLKPESETSNEATSESPKSSPVEKSRPENFHGAVRLKPKSEILATKGHQKLRGTSQHTRGKKTTQSRSLPTKSKNFHGAIRLKPKPGTKSAKKLSNTLPYTRHMSTQPILLETKSTKRSKFKNFHGAIRLKPKSSGTKSPKKFRSTVPYSSRKKVSKKSKSKNFHGAIRLKPKSSGTKSPKKRGSTVPYSRRKKVTTKKSKSKNFRLKTKSGTKSPKAVGGTLPYTSRKKSQSKNFDGAVRLKPKSGTKSPETAGVTLPSTSAMLENSSPESVYCLRRRVVHGTDRFRVNSKKLKWMDSGHFFRVYRLKPSLFTGSPFRFRLCPTPTNDSSTLVS